MQNEEYELYDDDNFEDAIDNCYQIDGNVCLAAGSEYCEFECPFRNELFE